MEKIDLSYIIVSYKDKEFLERAIKSIESNTEGLNYEILVVDNDNSEELKDYLSIAFKDVKYIAAERNYGYAKALNEGSKFAKGDIMCLMNADVEFLDNKIRELCLKMKANNNIGIIAPKLINSDGSLQISWGAFPNILNEAFTKLRDFFYKHKVIRKIMENKSNKEFYPKWATAACLFIKKDVWKILEGFDEGFFLYYEDCDFCIRAQKKGIKILYYPYLRLIHYLGKSKEKNNREAFFQAKRSQIYYYKKHNSFIQLYLLKIYLTIKGFNPRY